MCIKNDESDVTKDRIENQFRIGIRTVTLYDTLPGSP